MGLLDTGRKQEAKDNRDIIAGSNDNPYFILGGGIDMRKRFAGVILFFVMSICYVNTVFATAIGIPIPGVSDAINEFVEKHENFINKLSEFLGYEASGTDIHNWSLAISTLRADGFSDAAIAGILGNVKVEGGTNQFAIEGYSGKKTTDGKDYTQFELGKSYDYGDVEPSLFTNSKGKTMGGEGHGLVQWSFGRAENLTKFADSSEFDYVTVTHWHKAYASTMSQHTCKIPDMAGQVCFMVEELNTDYTEVKDAIKDSTYPSDAARIFHDNYEKSGTNTIKDRQDAAEQALDMVKACTVTLASSSVNKDNTEQKVAKRLVLNGVWGEKKFADFSQLVEQPITFPDKDDLSKEQLKGVTDWKNNIKYESEDNVIKYIRVFVMLFGILFLVWILLIYLSYWFDRINNFLDLELLPIITAGRLRVSPEEHECTFNPKSYSKGQAQTVNHRTVLFICMAGVFFAVLIISGYIYTLLNYLVRKMLSIIGIV